MKIAIKAILLAMVSAYLIYAVAHMSKDTEEIICEQVFIQVEDSLQKGLVNKEDVEKLLRKNKVYPEGLPLNKVNLPKIQELLSKDPKINHTQSFFTAQGKLCIKIWPLHPIVHIMTDKGEEYYMDGKGNIIPPGNINLDLCVATGKISKDFASKHLLPLASFIHKDNFWNKQIEQIYVEDEQEIELIPRIGNHTIILGDANNIEQKFHKLQLFYKNGLPRVGWNKYKSINLSFDGQVVCTRW